MSCGYNCTPIKEIYINKITTTTTGVVLIPSTTISTGELVNLNKYVLRIQCKLKATANLPIYIQTAFGNIPLLCRYAANNIFPDQLRTRYNYTLVFGNNDIAFTTGQFVLQNKVCRTQGRGTTGSVSTTVDDQSATDTNVGTKEVEVVSSAKSK